MASRSSDPDALSNLNFVVSSAVTAQGKPTAAEKWEAAWSFADSLIARKRVLVEHAAVCLSVGLHRPESEIVAELVERQNARAA